MKRNLSISGVRQGAIVLGLAIAGSGLCGAGPAEARTSPGHEGPTLTRVDLEGRSLTIRVDCKRKSVAELGDHPVSKRIVRVRCRSGHGRAKFALTSEEAARAASTRGLKIGLRLRGAKTTTLEFQRPSAKASGFRFPRARSSANLYWNLAYASCHSIFGIKQVVFSTNGATFGYRPATLIRYQDLLHVYNPANGAQYWLYGATKSIAAGFRNDSWIGLSGSRFWVRPAIQIVGGDWNWLNVRNVQGVSLAAPNWCYYA